MLLNASADEEQDLTVGGTIFKLRPHPELAERLFVDTDGKVFLVHISSSDSLFHSLDHFVI